MLPPSTLALSALQYLPVAFLLSAGPCTAGIQKFPIESKPTDPTSKVLSRIQLLLLALSISARFLKKNQKNKKASWCGKNQMSTVPQNAHARFLRVCSLSQFCIWKKRESQLTWRKNTNVGKHLERQQTPSGRLTWLFKLQTSLHVLLGTPHLQQSRTNPLAVQASFRSR